MYSGKTFQVVVLTHTLLSYTNQTHVKKVLIVCPVSVILNWVREYKEWIADNKNIKSNVINVYEISKLVDFNLKHINYICQEKTPRSVITFF